MKKILCVAMLVAAVGTMSSAMAGDTYVTGTVGQSNLRNTGVSDHIDTAGSIGLGWKFNQNVAAEIGYNNFGKFSDADGDAKADAFQASLVGSYDVAPQVALYGRLGVARTSLDVSDAGTVRKTTGLYGVGAQYQFTPRLAGTLEFDQYHRFAGSDDKLSTTSVGLKYAF